MSKIKKIQALCLFLVLAMPQANAALLTSPMFTPDYNVIPNGSDGPGQTFLFIEILNNVPITLDFDPLFSPIEQIDLVIQNASGTGWSNMTIEYTLLDPFDGVSLGLNVIASTSPVTIDNILTNPNTGLATGLDLSFASEESAFIHINGFAERSLSFDPSAPYSITISANAVPVPAAAWLFASGLLGLVGLARRKA